MIKTLSPYYLDIPFVSPLTGLTCTEFTLQIFVWSGLKDSPPAVSSWEITKKNPTGSTGTSRINIANIINDFIQFSPQEGTVTGFINGNNQYWVKWQTIYTTTNPSDYTSFSNQNIKLFTKGFSYGLDGENIETPTNKILLNGSEFKVNRNGFFVLPVEASEPPILPPSITITSVTLEGTNSYNLFSTSVGSYIGCNVIVEQVGEPFDLILDFDPFVSPLIVGVVTPATTTEYNITIQAFDILSGTLVTSNTFNLFLPL